MLFDCGGSTWWWCQNSKHRQKRWLKRWDEEEERMDSFIYSLIRREESLDAARYIVWHMEGNHITITPCVSKHISSRVQVVWIGGVKEVEALTQLGWKIDERCIHWFEVKAHIAFPQWKQYKYPIIVQNCGGIEWCGMLTYIYKGSKWGNEKFQNNYIVVEFFFW